MTKVIIDGGRAVDLIAADLTDTVGNLADGIGQDAYGHQGTFSFKVDGVVIHPDTQTGQVALTDDHTIELVEVTGQSWSGDIPAVDGVVHEAVPAGTVEDLIAWVGDDQERAEAVIATEGLQEHPRVTLVEHLRSHFGLDDNDTPT